jgi:hypothetical protein
MLPEFTPMLERMQGSHLNHGAREISSKVMALASGSHFLFVQICTEYLGSI